jgi:uncharacterized protein (TIGR02001 family)
VPRRIACALAIASPLVLHAEEAPRAFSAKAAVFTEYEYRGIAQTSEKPALQLNLDYAHASGFYAGTFLSNIRWIKDTGQVLGVDEGRANLEWDAYAGWRWALAPRWLLDVGYLHYDYPGASAVPRYFERFDTDEVYAGVTYGPATLKYSYSLRELFGVTDSKGSDYLELAVDQPVAHRWTVNARVGHQRYKGNQPLFAFDNTNFSYTVWKLGATYDFGRGHTVGAYYKGTDADPLYFTFKGRDWSRDRVVAFVTFGF